VKEESWRKRERKVESSLVLLWEDGMLPVRMLPVGTLPVRSIA